MHDLSFSLSPRLRRKRPREKKTKFSSGKKKKCCLRNKKKNSSPFTTTGNVLRGEKRGRRSVCFSFLLQPPRCFDQLLFPLLCQKIKESVGNAMRKLRVHWRKRRFSFFFFWWTTARPKTRCIFLSGVKPLTG